MHTPKLLYLLCAVALLAGLLPLTAAAEPPAQVSIPADLLRQIKADGQANFFVVMALQADLSAAYSMDWNTRGEYVWNTLQEVARTTQAPVVGYAERHSLDWTSFLTGNSVYIRGGSLTAAQGLAALPGVAYLRLEEYYQVDPIIAKAAAPEYAIDWGITDTNADDVWALGVQGTGIKVANIDTGVQYNHPALDQAFACPGDPGNAACWRDPANVCGGTACDNNGHGTHTMGTMIGDNDASLTYWVGMAPDATWIACKGCESSSCSSSSLNSCADWILAPGGSTANRPHIVNNSWGGGGGDAWYRAKVQAWVAAGIFPAFSAGNSTGCSSLGSPGDYQESFGTTGHNSSRAHVYAQGPSATFGHDPYTKPNISAPASSICSTVPTDGWNCGYSGTSMASPHSAGAVALLWSACPAYLGNVDTTFQILQNNADAPTPANPTCGVPPDGEGTYEDGYGYLNALAAVQSCIGGTGTLQGTVTDTSTGLPISGATVTAAPAAEGNGILATTDPSGFYSMALTPGTYNVTASADGYYSETATSVVVVENGTITQDFALQSLPPPVNLFCDDMESGPGNWTHSAAQGTDDWALVTTSYHSATHAWYTADVGSVSDKRLWNTVPIAIPSGVESATLVFWHRYAFESGWDGSVIEISTNNGATWSDLGSYITQNGYNATIGTGYGNPLAGRQAWSGTAAWNEVKVDLTAFIGMSVHVRFRIGTDSSVAGTGWWIDDVCYSTQGGGCEPPTGAAFTWTPTSPYMGDLVTFDGSASGTAPISYAWDFGDGATGSGASVTHTYAAPGDYVVTMTASNACGSAVAQHTLTVTGLPDVAVSPTALTAEQCPDSQTAQTLQICNNGTAPLTWSLSETPDTPWLAETPAAGTLPPAGCIDVDVTFDAAGLAPGAYAGNLLITSNDPDTPQVTIPVAMTVLQPAGISSVTYTATNLQVAFDASALGEPPLTYAWDFGDGGTAYVEDPTHTYAAGGCYLVTLLVSNGCGQDTWTGTVCVCDPVSGADFSWTPTSPYMGDLVTFNGSASGTAPISYAWDFGDGATGSGASVTHTYAAPGDYVVTMTASNACGSAIAQHTLTVTGLPDVAVSPSSLTAEQCPDSQTAQTLQICNNGTAPLTWSLSETPDTPWLAETPAAGTLPPAGCVDVDVTFDTTGLAPGDLEADLQIASNDPDEPLVTLPVALTVLAPVSGVDFTWSPPDPEVGEMVSFAGSVTDGEPPIAFNWDFGDAATGAGQNVTHTYAAPGDYLVTLAAGNMCGSAAAQHTLTVTGLPDIAVSPTALTAEQCPDSQSMQTLQICNAGTAPLSWSLSEAPAIDWLSEDPAAGSLPPAECVDVNVTFDTTGLAAGEYTTDLVVNSNDPDQPAIPLPITLIVLQPADITGVSYTATNLQVAFDATAVGEPPLTYAWYFGDGGTANVEDPTHTYAAGGCYPVTLVVSNDCGQDTWTGTVCVCDQVSGIDFSFSPYDPLVGETVTFSATVAAGTPPFTYAWDWGDGTAPGDGQYATHAYAAPGAYTVTLTVANTCGQSIATRTVTVHPVVQRRFVYLPIVTKSTWNGPKPY